MLLNWNLVEVTGKLSWHLGISNQIFFHFKQQLQGWYPVEYYSLLGGREGGFRMFKKIRKNEKIFGSTIDYIFIILEVNFCLGYQS